MAAWREAQVTLTFLSVNGPAEEGEESIFADRRSWGGRINAIHTIWKRRKTWDLPLPFLLKLARVCLLPSSCTSLGEVVGCEGVGKAAAGFATTSSC